jgi:hypothetical protein
MIAYMDLRVLHTLIHPACLGLFLDAHVAFVRVRLTADAAPLEVHSAPSAAASRLGSLGRHHRNVQPGRLRSAAAAARLEAALAGAECCVRGGCCAAGGGFVAGGCASRSMMLVA